MEKHNELKAALGFFGVLKETFELIFSNKKIFSQITLALIVPLSLILQANILVTQLLSSKIFGNNDNMHPTFDIFQYSNLNLSELNSFKGVAFWALIKFSYFFFTLIFSFLCTSTVAFIVSCIYTGKDINVKKAFSIIPKVWKQVLFTLLISLFIVFSYDVVFGSLLVLTLGFLFNGPAIIAAVVALILFFAGSLYITITWHLAIVVSVLEENVYGIKAITKSRFLLKGKIGIAMGMLVISGVCSAVIDAIFQKFALRELLIQNVGIRVGIGVFCFLLESLLILFDLVVQTVVYYVCKSYHADSFAGDASHQQKVNYIEEQNLV